MSCKENCDPGIKDCAEQIDSLRHWLGVSERRRKIAQDELSALRLRVEALEGALKRSDLFIEQTCNTLEEMLGDDVSEDRQREMCEGMIAAIQGYDFARAALRGEEG